MKNKFVCISALSVLLLYGCESQTKKSPTSTVSTAPPAVNSVVQSRALEGVIWGMPAVNYDLMYQAMVNQTHGDFNQIVYWSKLPSWKNQTLTPNPDSIYVMPFFNTKDVGPVVLEIPPAEGGTIVGSIDDVFQTAVEDVGPAGVDKGKGGKYLILPPNYKGKVPTKYFPMPVSTYESYALLRSILNSGSEADIAKALDYAKRIKVYPLSQASHAPETKWNDALDVVFDSTIPYDERFFQSLNRVVQMEDWLERDKAMIDQLKSIGIEKGKPFAPDAAMTGILKSAAQNAHTWLQTNYAQSFNPPYFSGTGWALPVSPDFFKSIQVNYSLPNIYPIDSRGTTYSFGFFSAKHLGAGQYYLFSIRDTDGHRLNGTSTYKLTVPANAPVKQYWSATVYDTNTHALIRNASRLSRSSQNPELKKNADGSVDVYFGPKTPEGKESNWVPTGTDFEVLFRFYGPEKPLFDKTWTLPDIERIQ